MRASGMVWRKVLLRHPSLCGRLRPAQSCPRPATEDREGVRLVSGGFQPTRFPLLVVTVKFWEFGATVTNK